MNFLFKNIVLCTLIIGVTACKSPNAKREQSMATLKSVHCCQSVSSIAVKPFPTNQKKYILEIQLKEKLPVADFPEGRSYFEVYHLPPIPSTGSTLTVTTSLSTTPGFAESTAATYVFRPVIQLLDSDYKVVNSLKYENYKRRGATLSGTLFLESNPLAKYLLVYADNSDKEEKMSFSQVSSQAVMVGQIPVYYATGSDFTTSLKSNPTGELQVQFE